MRVLRSGLSPADVRARTKFIGASDAVTIMSGDTNAILKLWNVKTGRAEPDDLSGMLRVVMGQHTEELNRFWFEKQTNRPVDSEGERRTRRGHPWQCCTLDGLTHTGAGHRAVLECKHVSGFNYNRDRVLQFYAPQLTHQMAVCDLRHAVLSMLIGTERWECVEFELDPFYERTLFENEERFWQAVVTGVLPGEMVSPSLVPMASGELIEMDMTGSNEWAAMAADYLETLVAVEKNEMAVEQLKLLVPPHARLCFGHGVRISRDKRNSLRIGRM